MSRQNIFKTSGHSVTNLLKSPCRSFTESSLRFTLTHYSVSFVDTYFGRSLSTDLCRPYVSPHCNNRLGPPYVPPRSRGDTLGPLKVYTSDCVYPRREKTDRFALSKSNVLMVNWETIVRLRGDLRRGRIVVTMKNTGGDRSVNLVSHLIHRRTIRQAMTSTSNRVKVVRIERELKSEIKFIRLTRRWYL